MGTLPQPSQKRGYLIEHSLCNRPTRKMDYELEMGYFVSQPVPYGESMPIAEAKEHIFGFVMLNDWSARDHQLFEMRPLGPFHSKGFGTSISSWIGTSSHLEGEANVAS